MLLCTVEKSMGLLLLNIVNVGINFSILLAQIYKEMKEFYYWTLIICLK